jgi:hypothetical protein
LAHCFDRKELKVAVWLAGTAVLAGVKEGVEAGFLCAVAAAAILEAPCTQTCICSFQIRLLQQVRLSPPFLRRKDKVVRDNGEFVEHEGMGRVLGREMGEQKLRRRVFKRIGFRTFGARFWFEVGRLLCEGRTIA